MSVLPACARDQLRRQPPRHRIEADPDVFELMESGLRPHAHSPAIVLKLVAGEGLKRSPTIMRQHWLDVDIAQPFRASVQGWQERIDDLLHKPGA